MKSNHSVIAVIACCAVTLAACQKPAAQPASPTGQVRPIPKVATAGAGSRDDVAGFRLSSVAVDCTSAMVFAPLAPEGDIYMRDACDDMSGITIGIDGQEVSLERTGASPRPGDTRLSYEGAGYRVEIQGSPGFWLPSNKGEETRTGCREFEERVDVGISHGAQTLNVPSRMTARCP